jgi:hypothetical protein
MEKELLTLPEHPSSPPVFSGVRVNRSLVLYVFFVDRCLSFCCVLAIVLSSSSHGGDRKIFEAFRRKKTKGTKQDR